MKKSDLGSYFIKDSELYEVISYIDKPAVEIKNLITGQKEVVVIGSAVAREFSKLFAVPVENNNYDLKNASPVDDIYLGDDYK